ncbi:MAG: transglycosylase SLT domain-containing protein [Woeseiaceae bacterium]|nr:transglycosylase SLT domain-containing protein [Woeseiaceae bacterium]
MNTAWKFHAVIAGILLAITSAGVQAADSRQLQAQRAAFQDVYAEVERGNWQPVARYQRLLDDYILWPDLRAAYLRAQLATIDHAEVTEFLDRYGQLKPARELRYVFALHLAEEGHLAEFRDIYKRHYSDLAVAKLDCIALRAAIEEGSSQSVVERGLQLWLSGKSQEDECDPVFDHLRTAGALTDDHYRQRFGLAIDARQFALARYLSSSLPDAYTDEATRWLEARDDSLLFVQRFRDRAGDEIPHAQLGYAIERIAFSEPLLAHKEWLALQDIHTFPASLRNRVDRHIALWAARRQLDEARTLLDALPAEASDAEVQRWKIRSSLRIEDWDGVLRSIASLPADDRQQDQWLFWEAIALQQVDQSQAASSKLASLARSRSYYGFLAADALGRDYTYAHNRLIPDAKLAEKLMRDPALVRARELFLVGLEGRGRSEWDAAVADLRPYEQVQAAILAHEWGWHSRAIATASLIGQFDDLEIRYPLPWREHFQRFSRNATIDDSLAYGIARSESLFMPDIRSHAGAVGVMQLLPETGRRLARELGQPWYGNGSLTDWETNIRLGTVFLRKMLDRFGGHPVLATAAYNAGPLKVDDWLPQVGHVDTRIWIENIPYNETREYVRRVLTADAIFHWRMTGKTKRLSAAFLPIAARSDAVAQVD